MSNATITITVSADAARAVLRAVGEDPDRSKWGHHQHLRSEAIDALRDALLDFIRDEAGSPLTDAEKDAAGISRRSDHHLSDGTPIE